MAVGKTRYCKNNVQQMKADACAGGLKDKDDNKFWRNVYMLSNYKATNLATCVGGCSDAVNVVKMWQEHFEAAYNTQLIIDIRRSSCLKLLRN